MTSDALDELIHQLPRRVGGIHSATIVLAEPFIEIARRFAHLPGTVALMSGGTLDSARYHILGIQPWLVIQANGPRLSVCWGKKTASADLEPFSFLQRLLQTYELAPSQQATPLSAGLLGYLSYDLKDFLEVLPRTSVDDLQLPALFLAAPSLLVVHDKLENTTCVHLPWFNNDENDAHRRLTLFEQTIGQPPPSGMDALANRGKLESGFSRRDYVSAVGAIREYIASGDVYQVNLSQRFQLAFQGNPFALYASLYTQNPAPFFAYINAGDHQVISTSPERFLRLHERTVETRPIKGTRPRGKTAEEDEHAKRELKSSPKDDAELSMIVDLMRNDIGKVCRAGSVHVGEHKRLEMYENVHHMVSVVRGVLDDDQTAIDLIRATFPGGSITGCPKIRAMEIIDELEPVRRHIYTGSIGYISFHGTMDLSIAIRTATVTAGKLLFSVGGGVVYDSDANDEFEETLHKGRTLMNALDLAAVNVERVHIAWHNGRFKPISELSVPIEDEGFLFGVGFFETIRVQHGYPVMLGDHLDRFNLAWQRCFDAPVPDITWLDVVRQVVARNDLSDKIAAVKILAAAGRNIGAVFDGTLLVTAKEYIHRLEGSSRRGLHLVTYPHRRHSHLSDFKTMNYMSSRMAARWAKDHGADEALILNADHSVSETNTANLFCIVNGRVCQPVSEHVLPGTMAKAVCQLLATWGRPVETRRLSVQDVQGAERVFLTNALMGAVPVTRLDEQAIADDDGLCCEINDALLSSGPSHRLPRTGLI
jgi:para-aminobenzoate synthetase component 1